MNSSNNSSQIPPRPSVSSDMPNPLIQSPPLTLSNTLSPTNTSLLPGSSQNTIPKSSSPGCSIQQIHPHPLIVPSSSVPSSSTTIITSSSLPQTFPTTATLNLRDLLRNNGPSPLDASPTDSHSPTLTSPETLCICRRGTWKGFMIKCDSCHKWKHGACVGITAKSTPAGGYVCPTCRAPGPMTERWSMQYDELIWLALLAASQDWPTTLSIQRLILDFKFENCLGPSHSTIRAKLHNVIAGKLMSRDVDETTKIRAAYYSRHPLPKDLLDMLTRNGSVRRYRNGSLFNFKSNTIGVSDIPPVDRTSMYFPPRQLFHPFPQAEDVDADRPPSPREQKPLLTIKREFVDDDTDDRRKRMRMERMAPSQLEERIPETSADNFLFLLEKFFTNVDAIRLAKFIADMNKKRALKQSDLKNDTLSYESIYCSLESVFRSLQHNHIQKLTIQDDEDVQVDFDNTYIPLNAFLEHFGALVAGFEVFFPRFQDLRREIETYRMEASDQKVLATSEIPMRFHGIFDRHGLVSQK